MPHFRDDNTNGYDAAQLAELNRRYNARLASLDDPEDLDNKSVLDWIAENVMADFDNEFIPSK